MKIIGVILLIIGIVSLAWGGVSYIKDRDTVDLGVAKIVTEEKGHFSIPPVLGIVSLAVGAVLIGMAGRGAAKQST